MYKRQETKRFHRDEKSWTRDPKVFVDTGLPIPGEPPLLKTRVHLRRDAAEQLWKELHRFAWQQWSLVGDLLLSLEPVGMGEIDVLAHTKRCSEISAGYPPPPFFDQVRWGGSD